VRFSIGIAAKICAKAAQMREQQATLTSVL
jgi:hypothetical protein